MSKNHLCNNLCKPGLVTLCVIGKYRLAAENSFRHLVNHLVQGRSPQGTDTRGLKELNASPKLKIDSLYQCHHTQRDF